MKLTEVQVLEKVPSGASAGDYTNRLLEARGWSLDYEAGMVVASTGAHRLLIPIGNVAYMKPAAVQAKPVKGKEAA